MQRESVPSRCDADALCDDSRGTPAAPLQGLIHNASDLVDALWAPGEGTLYGHTNLDAIVAASAAGDARSLADAYVPQHRGRALPSLATFYNVGLLGDGAIVSLDTLLQVRSTMGMGCARRSVQRGTLLPASVPLRSSPSPLAACSLSSRLASSTS